MDGPGDPEEPESDVPRNEDPEIFRAIFSTVTGVIQMYGWFILFGILAAWYLYNRYGHHLSRLEQVKESAFSKKTDMNAAHARMEAMERARMKMQAQLDEQAAEFAEKQKIKEEQKRQAKIEDWENHQQGKGYRSKARASETPSTSSTPPKPKPKKPLRPDYNPLMGDNSGACFRPPRRGGASGGG